MKKTFILLLLFSLFCSDLFASGKVSEMIRAIDEQSEIGSDFTASVSLTQKKVNQGTKVMEMIYYRRDTDDSFMILMTQPEVEKGNGYLKFEDNFWMYRRNTRTFQHISRDESIGGTDASADDFEKRKLTELYSPEKDSDGKEKYTEEMLGNVPVFKFTLKAKVDDVKYPTLIYWVKRDNFLPLKEQSFSLSGMLMETGYFLKYTTVNNKYIFVKGLFIDEFENQNKTMVVISGISTKKIDDSVFTKAYFENISK